MSEPLPQRFRIGERVRWNGRVLTVLGAKIDPDHPGHVRYRLTGTALRVPEYQLEFARDE